MKSSWMLKNNRQSFGVRFGIALWVVSGIALFFCINVWALDTLDSAKLYDVQARLWAQGYTETEPDGINGAQTEAALFRAVDDCLERGMAVTEAQVVQMLLSDEMPQDEQATMGDSGAAVMRIQRKLRVLSYLADKADGQFGENTARALACFQYDAQLELTGMLDQPTREKLFAISTKRAENPVLAKGMRGQRVEALQHRLSFLGFFTGTIDAQYGTETVEGVKALSAYLAQRSAPEPFAKLTATADPWVQMMLFGMDFPIVPMPMALEDVGADVYRLQRRLIVLGYLTDKPDGGYGAGTEAAVSKFQQRCGLKITGKANENTLKRLFSQDAPEAVKPYKLLIQLSTQSLYVYALDDAGAYSRLTYTMPCAIGPKAVPGNYRETTKPTDAVWTQLSDGSWSCYTFQLSDDIVISSIPYDAKKGKSDDSYRSKLGTVITRGAYMVSSEDAKLLYEKCPAKTPVEVVF